MNNITKIFLGLSVVALGACNIEAMDSDQEKAKQIDAQDTTAKQETEVEAEPANRLDTAAYNDKLLYMANGDTTGKWPVKAPYPQANAILPFNRIVAYYGNLYSKQMGILGELPKNEMLEKLQGEVKKWTEADSTTPAKPALHYIVTTAQSKPGKEGNYMLRMPFAQIDTVLRMASTIDALVFLDVQVGLSKLEKEIPMLDEYLKKPNIHLGIDPEFSMKTGSRPGTVIGYFTAEDINFVIDHLAKLVDENKLPPKVLIVHRFTQGMVRDYKKIKKVPQVQVVMDMDGWGIKAKKINTYRQFIYPEPVQFTGFKIFYKNDTQRVGAAEEMQPKDVLALTPKPIYIQYQ